MFHLIENQKGNKSGTGLGLYISKQIARKLTFEGDDGLNVTSEFGKGTSFSFNLEGKVRSEANIQSNR